MHVLANLDSLNRALFVVLHVYIERVDRNLGSDQQELAHSLVAQHLAVKYSAVRVTETIARVESLSWNKLENVGAVQYSKPFLTNTGQSNVIRCSMREYIGSLYRF